MDWAQEVISMIHEKYYVEAARQDRLLAQKTKKRISITGFLKNMSILY
jgi:hypothetical protein